MKLSITAATLLLAFSGAAYAASDCCGSLAACCRALMACCL